MKGLMYEVAPQELSEADTLNELQWHGQVRISCRASRSYGHDWGSELPDRAYMYEFTHYDLAKRKGQWTIPPSPPSYYTKPSEAEIKKLLAQ